MDLINLTKEDEEMEADPTPVLVPLPIVIIKTEPTEVVEVAEIIEKVAEGTSADANPNAPNITNVAAARAEWKDMTDAELEAEQREFDAEFGHIEEDNVNEFEFDDK
jgi:hypothetical protein